MNKLKNKVAVIYGSGGVGGTVAMAFAAEGATVYLAGRNSATLKAIEASDVSGNIHTATVDALDQKAVEEHLRQVVARSGK